MCIVRDAAPRMACPAMLSVVFTILAVMATVDCTRWPGTKCPPRGEWFMVDKTSKGVYYQCVHGRPLRRPCPPGLTCPCIGKNCDKPEGQNMQCKFLYECHVWDNADSCYPNPCSNGGKCKRRSNNRYKCKCAKGYMGRRCKKDAPVKGVFNCESGFASLSKPDTSSFDYEQCNSWCYVRENYAEQSLTKGCWYPEIHNEPGVTVNTNVLQKGCALLADHLGKVDKMNMLCFCKHGGKECNAGPVDHLVKTLQLFGL